MIDGSFANPWPTEIRPTLARFKQGDLVAHPPFFYAGVARYGICSLTLTGDDASTKPEIFELDSLEEELPYGLITTQTCNLDEQRPNPREPWIQVAPVYKWDDLEDGSKRQVERHKIGHLVKLTGAELPNGFWVADLRIEVPVEKSWLVGRDSIPGFADEEDYLRLGERLAGRRSRPALATVISDEIVTALRQAFEKLSKTKKAALLDPVEDLRLFVTGNRLQPTAAQLLIITTEDPAPQYVVNWFDTWWCGVQKSTENAGLSLLGSRYTTLEKLTARAYVNSIALDFRYLSPED